MRIFHYKHTSDNPVPNLPQIIAEIERALGPSIRLMVDNADKPNEVHGYVNAYLTEDGAGHIEVHLYDKPDVTRIGKLPDDAVTHRGMQKVNSIDNATVHQKVNSVLSKKGYSVHLL